MMDPKEIGEFQHEEFYRFIAQAYDKPRYTLHYKTDAPLNIRSIFYVPEMVSFFTAPKAILCVSRKVSPLFRSTQFFEPVP